MKDLATIVQGLKYSDSEEKTMEATESYPEKITRYLEGNIIKMEYEE